MMKKSYKLNKTQKQKEAIRLISKNTTTLLEGGGRSGKTILFLYVKIIRRLFIPSHGLITRFSFSHAKQSICYQTMPMLLKILGLEHKVHLNKSDWFYEFPNGSTEWIGGLDDKNRTEKILGNEYSDILFNEASQIPYESFDLTISRLNPSKGLRGKIMIDYNPPSKKHWGYKIFHLRQFPDGRPVPEDNFGVLKMNPADNPYTSSEYMKILEMMSPTKQKRFKDGEYSDDQGSLWKREWIKFKDIKESFQRIVIGVDPTGTTTGDECGIIVDGLYNGEYYCLDDFSLHGTPNEWANAVSAAYEKWKADIVVAEKNFGGDMVESTLKNSNQNMNVKLVSASRSKIVRAEPISALYEQGKVFHRKLFNDLEDELCSYTPQSGWSPNRMDAHVFAITELSGESGGSIWD